MTERRIIVINLKSVLAGIGMALLFAALYLWPLYGYLTAE